MPRFPYFNFPGFYYRNYNHYPSYAYGQSNVSKNSNVANNLSKSSVNQSNSNFFREIAIDKCHDEKKEKLNDDSFLFDLFGLKLYLDDIIILCLLFFLYTEGVKDDGLFLALVMLLLT